MSYKVYKTNSQATPNQYTVEDGVLNQQTDLSFVGKGYGGYGEVIAENFLHLLESFSNNTAPANPITGQLWYNENSGKLYVYNGTQFGAVGGALYVSAVPTGLNAGDIYIDSATQQLYFWNGSSSVLVGPPIGTTTNNGLQFVSITDIANVVRPVTEVYNNNTLVAIISDTSFTPQSGIAGFPAVTAGITLSTAITGAKFAGTATNANTLSGVAATSFVRNDIASTINAPVSIANDTPLTLGRNGDLNVLVNSGTVVLQNNTQNAGIQFNVNNAGNAGTTVMSIVGSTARVGIGTTSPSTALQVAGTVTASGFAGPITGAVTTSGITITSAGTITIQGSSVGTQTELQLAKPTQANTLTLPNITGTLITSADSGTVTGNMLKNSTSLQILSSTGAILKTLYAAGSAS